MSGKRPSLAESMQRMARTPDPSPPIAAPASAPKPVASAAKEPMRFYAATRAGKKKVTASLEPMTHKQLKGLAAERECTTEMLMTEAISDLFAKYSWPPARK